MDIHTVCVYASIMHDSSYLHSCMTELYSHLIGMFCFGLLHTQSSRDWKLEFQHCELESVELFLRAVNFPDQQDLQ